MFCLCVQVLFSCVFVSRCDFCYGSWLFFMLFSQASCFCFWVWLFVSCCSEVNIVCVLGLVFFHVALRSRLFIFVVLFGFVFRFRTNDVMSYVAVYSTFHKQKTYRRSLTGAHTQEWLGPLRTVASWHWFLSTKTDMLIVATTSDLLCWAACILVFLNNISININTNTKRK